MKISERGTPLTDALTKPPMVFDGATLLVRYDDLRRVSESTEQQLAHALDALELYATWGDDHGKRARDALQDIAASQGKE